MVLLKNYKIKQKNSGFTITEVVTTLVILGIVLSIAIPSVGKLQNKFKVDYYEQLNGSVLAAAKTFFKDNVESKPSGDLSVSKLTYDKLTGSKYIDSIEGYKGDSSCDGYVAVLKVKDQYIYENCMKCNNGLDYNNYSVDIKNLNDFSGDEKDKVALSNICALAGKETSAITTEYNSISPESMYMYAGSYSGEDLKETLAINEQISLIADGKIAYSVSTGNKIYPKNITGIDLSKETVNVNNINVGINVKYQNNEERTIHVYNYDAPIITNVNGKDVHTDGIVRSVANSVKINLSSINFVNNDDDNKYPKAQTIGPDFNSKLTPSGDILGNYEYSINGTDWNELNCNGRHECEFNSKTLNKSDKIKFRMKIKTAKGVFYKETNWYAVKNLLNVAFDANGGNIISGQTSKEVELNQKYGTLPIADKDGYTFEGWQTASNAGTIVTENTIVSREEDHSLFAKWQIKTYVVTLNANGGTININNSSVSTYNISIKYNGKFENLPQAEKTGYTFKGWYTSTTGGTAVTSNTIMGNGDITNLYARWEAIPIVVTLNANGGSVSPTTMSVSYDSTYGTLPTPTRTGYTFVGWFNEDYKNNSLNYYADAYSDLKNAYGYNQDNLWNHYNRWGRDEGRRISQYISTDKVTTTRAHTIYAGWIANSYTVTLNANGGSVSPTSMTLKYGSQYGTLPEPTRSGYVFNGWYTSTSGGTQITSTSTMNTASNQTLYAQWTQIVTVTQTSTTCSTSVSLPAGVYYIEIVGGGAGGRGKSGQYGGNAARWAGYVYLPGATSGKVCVGKGTAGTHGFIGSTPSNGDPSYLADNSGNKLIEAMGGINYTGTYSSAITNIGNGAVQKTVCKNIAGKTRNGNSVKYGYGGAKSGLGTYTNASDGTAGIIIYQYVKTLDAWNNSPMACPSSTLCSSSDCGW